MDVLCIACQAFEVIQDCREGYSLKCALLLIVALLHTMARVRQCEMLGSKVVRCTACEHQAAHGQARPAVPMWICKQLLQLCRRALTYTCPIAGSSISTQESVSGAGTYHKRHKDVAPLCLQPVHISLHLSRQCRQLSFMPEHGALPLQTDSG